MEDCIYHADLCRVYKNGREDFSLQFSGGWYKIKQTKKRGYYMSDVLTYQVPGTHTPKTKQGFAKMLALLEAADKLFNQRGFSGVSVSDICKEAHTAVGTFYIYFDSKTDLYRYLVEIYKRQIKGHLAKAIAGCATRAEKEKEGIKCFVRYAVNNPNVYNIIWGSLAVDQQMFADYYTSFAQSYARALQKDAQDLKVPDATSLAYALMGITNFLGLRAIFEKMTDQQIDEMMERDIMPMLLGGVFHE